MKTAVFVIVCSTPETRQQAEELARQNIDLRNEIESVWRSFPGGVEQRTITRHRLRDYFKGVWIEQQAGNPSAFRIAFNPRENAGNYWRDLMAGILHSLSESLDVSVKPLRAPPAT